MTGQNRRVRKALLVLLLFWAAGPANAAPVAHHDDDWAADTEICDGLDWRSALIDEDLPIVTPCLPDQVDLAPAPADSESAAGQHMV